MTRATLEYTRVDAFTIPAATYVDIPMVGPTGTKSMITLMVSGGAPGGLTGAIFHSTSISTVECTRIFSANSAFSELWTGRNVPINTSPTTYMRLFGSTDQTGHVEVGYWNALAVSHMFAGGNVGTSGGTTLGVGSANTDTVYGAMVGAPNSDWYLNGSPDMEAIYPSYATLPPQYTNSHSVVVGFTPQPGAPRATTGFIHEPTTAGYTFGFSFSTSTSWELNLVRLTGPTPVVIPPFYSQTEDQWGFAHATGHVAGTTPSDWWHLAPAPAPAPPGVGDWISAIACDPSDPDKLYAVWVDDKYVRISTDAGVTWTSSMLFPAPATTPRPSVFRLCVRPGGQIFLLNMTTSDTTRYGIWRSVDNGVNWTRIVPFTGTSTAGYFDTSSTKLWYMGRVPAITFYRANHDGTGAETLGTGSGTGGRQIVHALDDNLCLFIDYTGRWISRVTSAGTTNICPADFRPWDAIPLTASTFVAVGTPGAGGNNVLVYRTVNAGTDWTLIKTITALEGFAEHGSTSSYFHIDAVAPARTDLVMTGHASSTVQQMYWVSTDAGLTWTKVLNEADPFVDGFWTVTGPGGVIARPAVVPQVATPSRLATIVG